MIYDFTMSVYNTDILHKTIKESEIGSTFSGLVSSGSQVSLHFADELTSSGEIILTEIINNHQATVTSTFDYAFEASRNTQQENITFGQNILHDWMRKNVLEGMSVKQSLWVFSRFENFTVNCDFGEKHVDLFKMFQSGAIPTVYYCILQVQPDPMTEDYHWLTQARLDWVKDKIEQYIGPGMAAYIQSLQP